MSTWYSDGYPASPDIDFFGWCRVLVRGGALVLLIASAFLVSVILRIVERAFWGQQRPMTPWVTQFVCRTAFRFIGVNFVKHGEPMQGPGAVVANHSSWLDIFALNACKRIYFVSKSEVASWAGIGLLARVTGTVFIQRSRREASAQIGVFRERLSLGHKLLFFPEGTSTDGRRVLPFKPTLFAAFFDEALREMMKIQPVTVRYTAPAGRDSRFYGWWGDMDLGPHLLAVLAQRQHGEISVIYHRPIVVADCTDRKALAGQAELAVRRGLLG